MHPLRAALLPAALLLLLLASAPVHAASPEPSADSGDTRTAGEPPGFIGAPLFAVAGVLLIGLLAAGATIAYVRLTGGPGPAEDGVTGTGAGASTTAHGGAMTSSRSATVTAAAPAGPSSASLPGAGGTGAAPTPVVDESRVSGQAIRQ